MKRRLIFFIFAGLSIMLTFSACDQIGGTTSEDDTPTDGEYWENPWEDLPIVSRDGSGVVGPEGGEVWLEDIVGVKVPKDLFDEREEVEVSVSIEDFNPNELNLVSISPLDESPYKWASKYIKIGYNSAGVNFSVTLNSAADRLFGGFFSSLSGYVLDVLATNELLTFGDSSIYAAASYMSDVYSIGGVNVTIANIAVPELVNTTVTNLIFRAIPINEVRARCEAAGGRFIYGDSLAYAPPIGDAVNYICVPPLGKVWDRVHLEMIEKTRWNPTPSGEYTLLTANLGSTFGQYSVGEFMFKLAYPEVAQRIANNISMIQPDILTLQEVFDQSQMETLLDTSVYAYSCARYPSGNSFECVAWKKSLAGTTAQEAKTIVGGSIPGEGSFMQYCADDEDDEDCGPILFSYDYCTPNSGDATQKNTGAHLTTLTIGEHTLQVASVHTATVGVIDSKWCRSQQLLKFLTESNIAQFNAPTWLTNYSSPPTLLAGDFNIDPERGGAGLIGTIEDMFRFRWIANWSPINPAFDQPEFAHTLIVPSLDYDILIPWRSENTPTAHPPKKSFDHILSLPGFFQNQMCEVLNDQHRLDANYWWAYNASAASYAYGGMDHRAIVCGFDFAPYFDADLSTDSIEVPQGGSQTVDLYITPKAGFSGDVAVQLVYRNNRGSYPSGITVSPSSISVDANSTNVRQLSISATGDGPGSYELELLLRAGDLIRSVPLNVDVVPPPPGFTLSLNTEAIAVAQGESTEITLTVIPIEGFTGMIDLYLEQEDGTPPPGISIEPPGIPITSPETEDYPITIRTSAETPPGIYNLKLIGVAEDISASTDLSLIVTDPTQTYDYKFILTWGEAPRDLDIHLWLPDGTHIYYANMNALPYAALDVDNINGNGMETMTIYQLQNGVHTIAVYNYSGEAPLAGSGAKVTIQTEAQGIIEVLEVPDGDPNARWWTVATVDGETGELRVINELGDSVATTQSMTTQGFISPAHWPSKSP